MRREKRSNVKGDEQDYRSMVARSMAQSRRRHRGHADYWRGPNQEAEELYVAKTLLTFLNRREQLEWKLRSRGQGQDPPDCEAVAESGMLVGIEVTELVDQSSIEEVVRGGCEPLADWSREQLTDHLQRLLHRKDAPARTQGGPYQEYLLAIHTDEPSLTAANLDQLLLEHTFPEMQLITAAFILVGFDPRRATCPVVELRLESSSRGD